MLRVSSSGRNQRIQTQGALGLHHFETQRSKKRLYRRVLVRFTLPFPPHRVLGRRLSKGGNKPGGTTIGPPNKWIRRLKFRRTRRTHPSRKKRHAVRVQHLIHCCQTPFRPGPLLSPQSKAHMLYLIEWPQPGGKGDRNVRRRATARAEAHLAPLRGGESGGVTAVGNWAR